MQKAQLSYQLKDLKFKLDEKADGDMSFTAYGSVFGNIDRTGDIVQKGCFEKSLMQRMPKGCYQHNTEKLAFKVTEAKEDEYGLFISGRFLKTETGMQCYTEVKEGVIDTLSIGYMVKDCEWVDDIRVLKEVDLYEVSFVTFPANEKAKVTSVKNYPTIREFEADLREKGFSQKQAKIIAKNSFEALQRDVVEKKDNQRDAEILSGIDTFLNNIKNR